MRLVAAAALLLTLVTGPVAEDGARGLSTLPGTAWWTDPAAATWAVGPW